MRHHRPARNDALRLTRKGLSFRGQTWPCTIGRSGRVTNKCEGDGGTPVGRHRIAGLLYRSDRLRRPAPWARAIGPRSLWSDDPSDPAYNHPVTAPYTGSHESLRRSDPLYDVILVINWNYPIAMPGRGSAIFIHQWRRRAYPTEGCIALPRQALLHLARRVMPGTPVLIPPP